MNWDWFSKMASRFERKVLFWSRLGKLTWELNSSRRFQKQCRQANCTILAELEGKHQSEIRRKIQRQREATDQG